MEPDESPMLSDRASHRVQNMRLRAMKRRPTWTNRERPAWAEMTQ